MAWGRRCTMGCATWPDEALYSKCPECGETTDRFRNAGDDLLDNDEAKSRLLRAQFLVYYERWDAQRDPERVDADAPPIDVEANLAASRANTERRAARVRSDRGSAV